MCRFYYNSINGVIDCYFNFSEQKIVIFYLLKVRNPLCYLSLKYNIDCSYTTLPYRPQCNGRGILELQIINPFISCLPLLIEIEITKVSPPHIYGYLQGKVTYLQHNFNNSYANLPSSPSKYNSEELQSYFEWILISFVNLIHYTN